MQTNYLTHYARVNGIDLSSELSIKNWFENGAKGLDLELREYIYRIKDKSILDIGSGTGNLLNYLLKNSCTNVLGVDNSSEQLDICRKYVSNKVVQDDIFHFLRFTNSKFDFIFIFDVIEHIQKERIEELLKLVYDALNKNGEIVIRTLNMNSLIGIQIRYDDFTHETGFTANSLIQILESVGYKDISISNTYLGAKRKYVMKLFYKVIYKLHFLNPPAVMTFNILANAKK